MGRSWREFLEPSYYSNEENEAGGTVSDLFSNSNFHNSSAKVEKSTQLIVPLARCLLP